MTAQNPPATNGDMSREWGAPESTRIMQDRSYSGEALEVAESRVPAWAASFGMAQQVGPGMG